MPVVEAVQTFVGIANENEFYSHHYLSEVFKGDIRERLEQWAAAEEAHPEQCAPYKQLASWASQWFALRHTGTHGSDAAEQLASFQHVQQGLLQALGYTITPQLLELQAGMPVPVWQVLGDAGKAPQVLVVPAYNPGQEDDDQFCVDDNGDTDRTDMGGFQVKDNKFQFVGLISKDKCP